MAPPALASRIGGRRHPADGCPFRSANPLLPARNELTHHARSEQNPPQGWLRGAGRFFQLFAELEVTFCRRRINKCVRFALQLVRKFPAIQVLVRAHSHAGTTRKPNTVVAALLARNTWHRGTVAPWHLGTLAPWHLGTWHRDTVAPCCVVYLISYAIRTTRSSLPICFSPCELPDRVRIAVPGVTSCGLSSSVITPLPLST